MTGRIPVSWDSQLDSSLFPPSEMDLGLAGHETAGSSRVENSFPPLTVMPLTRTGLRGLSSVIFR